jgi:hypothetical protein
MHTARSFRLVLGATCLTYVVDLYAVKRRQRRINGPHTTVPLGAETTATRGFGHRPVLQHVPKGRYCCPVHRGS